MTDRPPAHPSAPEDPVDPIPSAPLDAVRRCVVAQTALINCRSVTRSQAIQAMAKALRSAQNDILEANTLDLEASRDRNVAKVLLNWLKLTPERMLRAVEVLERLGDLPDPIRQAINVVSQSYSAETYCQRMPLGTIAFICEGPPELQAIAAGMCIKTGNSVVLYSNTDAANTHAAIIAALQTGLEAVGLPIDCLMPLCPSHGLPVRELLAQDEWLNLIIPYGRPALTHHVVQYATAPVLRAAIGNCHLYWSASGSLEMVRWAIHESYRGEPDAVNAIEGILVHPDHLHSSLGLLCNTLRDQGFELRADPQLQQDFPDLRPTGDRDWSQAYLSKTIALKTVNGLPAAIDWINRYSSGHADSIITESYVESHQFALGINSASIYINASPQFQRSPRGSGSVLLGMSNQRGQRRGPIGLESLTTLKQIIQGDGES